MSDRSRASAYVIPRVRMGIGATEAAAIDGLYAVVPVEVWDRLCDQLWLRAVLVEQRRRTNISERREFDERANGILGALDLHEVGFNRLVALAQEILDEHYPADVPLVCDRESPDPGPRLAAALRDVLAVRAPEASA